MNMERQVSAGVLRVCLVISLTLFDHSLSAQNKVWSLKECIDQALAKNIALNQFKLNNEYNRVNYEQARANVYPNLNLSDVHTFDFAVTGNNRNEQSGNSSAAANLSNSSSYNNLSLNSSITLFNTFRLKNLVRQSELTCNAGNLDVEVNKNNLLLNVLAAYMQVLYEYDAVDIAQSQVSADTAHVVYTEKYVLIGNLPEANLLQVKAQLATDRASLIAEETQLSLARLTLMQLMEIPYTIDFDIKRPPATELLSDVSLTSSEIYNIAEGTLPDVRSALLKTSASEYGLKVSRSAIFPRLSLGGSLGTSYSSANSLISYNTTSSIQQIGYLRDNPSQVVVGPVTSSTANTSGYPFLRQFGDNFLPALSINLTVPIYNNLIYKTEIERSKISIDIARLNESAVKNQLRKSIEVAYTNQLAASKEFIATKEQMLAEERAYADLEKRYRQGMANLIDLLVEKDNYRKAEFAHLQAKYVYLFRTKIIAFYTGNLITE